MNIILYPIAIVDEMNDLLLKATTVALTRNSVFNCNICTSMCIYEVHTCMYPYMYVHAIGVLVVCTHIHGTCMYHYVYVCIHACILMYVHAIGSCSVGSMSVVSVPSSSSWTTLVTSI